MQRFVPSGTEYLITIQSSTNILCLRHNMNKPKSIEYWFSIVIDFLWKSQDKKSMFQIGIGIFRSPFSISSVSSLPFTPFPLLSSSVSSSLHHAPRSMLVCSPLFPHKSCQCIHQRSLPVDCNLVGGIIFLFVVPSGCRMSTTDDITRPRIYFIVGTRTPVMRIHCRLNSQSSDVRAIVEIAAKNMGYCILRSLDVDFIWRNQVGYLKVKYLTCNGSVTAP